MPLVKCPYCKQNMYIPCEYGNCNEPAEYEAWFGKGLIRKLKVCGEHIKLARGYTPEKLATLNTER